MSNELTMLTDPSAFQQAMLIAKVFANSGMVPAHLKGKQEDCFIALHMAARMNLDPVMVMQSIYFVSGKPGWSASFMVAQANRSGVFSDQITWHSEGKGDSLVVTASATLAKSGKLVSAEASIAMAKAEGWTKNAKYQSMPEHMLRYRASTFLIRLYAPEVMFGMSDKEENEDVLAARAVDVTPKPERRTKAQPVIEAATYAPETPHDAETGEIFDAEEHRDGSSSDPEMYVLELRPVGLKRNLTEFLRAEDFRDAYLAAMKAASPDAQEILKELNFHTVARARADMAPSHDDLKRNAYVAGDVE